MEKAKNKKCELCGKEVEMSGMRHCHSCLDMTFKMVQHPEDWKAPICILLDPGDWNKVSGIVPESIEFFTATETKVSFVDTEYGFKVLVEADGYRNGPAA